jgi:hypothetical protein
MIVDVYDVAVADLNRDNASVKECVVPSCKDGIHYVGKSRKP